MTKGPLAFTPNFPAYPSGHATFGTAAFTVMIDFVGENYEVEEFVSDELNDNTKDPRFKDGVRPKLPQTFTLKAAITLNLESRIHLGVHWRIDGDEGKKRGAEIGEKVVKRIATEV